MNTKRIILPLVTLILSCAAWAVNPAEIPATEIAPVAQKPPAENILILPMSTPVPVTDFRVQKIGDMMQNGTPARNLTGATLRWDATGLEVIFDCADTGIIAEQTGRDNIKLWKDDCVYVWLDPGHLENATHQQMMLQLTASGAFHDHRDGDAAFNIEGIAADVARTDTGWRGRITMPWKGLGATAPKPGDVWGINLTRVDHPGKYNYNTMETSSWMPFPNGDAADTTQWAHVIFSGTTVTADVLAVKRTLEAKFQAEKAAAAAKHTAKRLAIEPANPNASPDTYRVLKYLAGLPEKPNKRVIVGQRISGVKGTESEYYRKLVTALAETTGKWIPLIAIDNDGSPQGRDDQAAAANQIAIEHWKAGGLVVMDTHPNNPFNGKWIWVDQPPFHGSKDDLIKPGTPANKAWMAYLDKMARHLIPLRDAGVVVLWRPFHEMNFKTSWWWDVGPDADAEGWKNMWRHMFNYFTYERGLNNLLWVYGTANAEDYGFPADFCYPGDEYVDIVGVSYYTDLYGQIYDRLVALGKPFAFTEYGPPNNSGGLNFRGPLPDGSWDDTNLVKVISDKYPQTVYALHWTSWPNNIMSVAENRNAKELLNHPMILTRGELDWQSIKVPESWLHPLAAPMTIDVIQDNGILRWLRLGRGTLNIQGEMNGLPSAKDLKLTREEEAKTYRGTVVNNNLAVQMVQRVSVKDGNLVLNLEASTEGPAPELCYTMQVPTTRFAGGTYTADETTAQLPSEPLPMDAIKFYQGKAGKLTFMTTGGSKLSVELEPEAEITIQDSRRWSPNFSIPIVVHPDKDAKDGNTTLTIRVRLE